MKTTDQQNVDTTKTTTHISLCAGYGGIDIGLGRAISGLRTIAFSEIEAFACANLVAKMEAGLLDCAPIWTDLKTFPWADFRDRVDILSGGYPCQPFSAAGKRAGKDDPRHLWPYIADGIQLCRPRVCFFENVEGHISLGLSDVIEDLAGMGYRTTWGIFSASEVGAPHQRKRVFILAYRKSDERGQPEARNWGEMLTGGSAEELANSKRAGLEGQHHRHASAEPSEYVGADAWAGGERGAWPSRPGEPQHAWEPPRVVGKAIHDAGVDVCGTQCGQEAQSITGDSGSMGNADGTGSQERSRERRAGVQRTDADGGTDTERQAEPALGRDPHGSADWLDDAELFVTCDNRTDELRLLGNGVVPATAELAFRTLMKELTNN